jgi:hypothetical protein
MPRTETTSAADEPRPPTRMQSTRSVSIKTRSTIHDDQATKENPDNPDMAQAFVNLLDSPNRIIIEHEPVKYISYDGIAVRDDLVAKIIEAASQNP